MHTDNRVRTTLTSDISLVGVTGVFTRIDLTVNTMNEALLTMCRFPPLEFLYETDGFRTPSNLSLSPSRTRSGLGFEICSRSHVSNVPAKTGGLSRFGAASVSEDLIYSFW
jgi:hypothetical protein